MHQLLVATTSRLLEIICLFCKRALQKRHDVIMHSNVYRLSNAPSTRSEGMERTHIAKCCNTLQNTATHCNTMQRTATHCITLHRTRCNPLQPTATHLHQLLVLRACSNRFYDIPTNIHVVTRCNTLQHTQTLCNTLVL